jgi:hypothetical protein
MTSSFEELVPIFVGKDDKREPNIVSPRFGIRVIIVTSLNLLSLTFSLRKYICSPQGGKFSFK